MSYKILKVTIVIPLPFEGAPAIRSIYPMEYVENIEDYRNQMKREYEADKVALCYEELPKNKLIC